MEINGCWLGAVFVLTHHVRIVNQRVKEICRLHQAQTTVPQRCNGGIHPDACNIVKRLEKDINSKK